MLAEALGRGPHLLEEAQAELLATNEEASVHDARCQRDHADVFGPVDDWARQQSMKRWLVGGAVLYVALMLFCSLGAGALPASTQQAIGPHFWLLGPPANLIHGTSFLWPFVIGTSVVAGLTFGISRSESPGVQVISGVALLIAWAVFGFIAYAPGA